MHRFTRSICLAALKRAKQNRLYGYPLGRGYNCQEMSHFRYILRTDACDYR